METMKLIHTEKRTTYYGPRCKGIKQFEPMLGMKFVKEKWPKWDTYLLRFVDDDGIMHDFEVSYW